MKARIIFATRLENGMLRLDLTADDEAAAMFMAEVGNDMILDHTDGEREKLRNLLEHEGLMDGIVRP